MTATDGRCTGRLKPFVRTVNATFPGARTPRFSLAPLDDGRPVGTKGHGSFLPNLQKRYDFHGGTLSDRYKAHHEHAQLLALNLQVEEDEAFIGGRVSVRDAGGGVMYSVARLSFETQNNSPREPHGYGEKTAQVDRKGAYAFLP